MDASEILLEPSALDAVMARGAILIDARKPGEFRKGHIPGAMPLSTYELLVTNSSLDGMKTFADAAAGRFSSVGVNNERQVVIYDEGTGMRAARELWILEYIGHRNARMLHGGLLQWQAAGGPVLIDTDIATVRPKKIQLSIASGCNAPADEIVRRAGSWNMTLIDVRNDLEWAGKDKTNCCPRRGRIPHAIHIEWTKFLDNGRYKSPEAIMALLEKHDINPRNELVVYCHRGSRSASTYFALKYAGLPGARNYIGSWHEWSSRQDLPIEQG
ncbi:MAG: rhodanese-like domain-containing protein [Burkholderiales bacterium]